MHESTIAAYRTLGWDLSEPRSWSTYDDWDTYEGAETLDAAVHILTDRAVQELGSRIVILSVEIIPAVPAGSGLHVRLTASRAVPIRSDAQVPIVRISGSK
jgi:hypothetical protein